MKEIKNEEMKLVEGGSAVVTGITIASIVTIAISMISGILSGFANPPSCRN